MKREREREREEKKRKRKTNAVTVVFFFADIFFELVNHFLCKNISYRNCFFEIIYIRNRDHVRRNGILGGPGVKY